MDTITAYQWSRIRKTAPITERQRGLRGVYGPLASERPMRFYIDELQKRGLMPSSEAHREIARAVFAALIEAVETSNLDQSDAVRTIYSFMPALERLAPDFNAAEVGEPIEGEAKEETRCLSAMT
jgi:hypothetical protein